MENKASTIATSKGPKLSREEESQLVTRMLSGNCTSSREKLVSSHLGLVIHIANQYRGYKLSTPDLVQEGNVGLMKAVNKFNPSFNVRFGVYAQHFIKSEIYDYILRNYDIIRMATTKPQRRLFFNFRRLAKKFYDLPVADRHLKIALELDVPLTDVELMAKRFFSLAASLNDDSNNDEIGLSMQDRLPSPSSTPEELYIQHTSSSKQSRFFREQLSTYDERTQHILASRYPQKEDRATLEELAEYFNVSKERVRQIEKQAITEMTAAANALH